MSIISVIPYRVISFVRTYFLRVSVLVLFLVFVWPDRYASHYPYISHENIYDELVKKTTENVSKATAGKLNCEYGDIIAENRYMYREPYISQLFDGSDIRIGGEYMPTECAPQFSTAVIVVYRNRAEQLKAFLTYIHNYLRKQQIHYRIFIVEQFDQKPFNRAMLFNIGSLYAAQYGFPCMVLHDVDLMPLRLGNLYACTRCPRHLCAGLDKFRFNLLYQGLFGGVVSIETPTFQFVNGMSNMVSGQNQFFFLCWKQVEIQRDISLSLFYSSMAGVVRMMTFTADCRRKILKFVALNRPTVITRCSSMRTKNQMNIDTHFYGMAHCVTIATVSIRWCTRRKKYGYTNYSHTFWP